jgi:hypothetical protein
MISLNFHYRGWKVSGLYPNLDPFSSELASELERKRKRSMHQSSESRLGLDNSGQL